MEFLTSGIRRTAGPRARLPFVLPAFSGVRLNAFEVGRLLRVSAPTARAYLRNLEETGLVTCVPFYGGGRRPLLIAWEDDSPRAVLLHALEALRPGCRFHWWMCASRRVVELVADLGADSGDERVGFCFSSAPRPRRRDWEPLALAIDRGVISRGFLLHAGNHASRPSVLPIIGLPLDVFMQQTEEWMFTWRAPRESWRAMTQLNRANPCRPGFPCRAAPRAVYNGLLPF